MKAFLYEMNEHGSDMLGSDRASVTKEYKTLRGLWIYAIVPFAKSHGNCHALIYYNWDNRYGSPDKQITYCPNRKYA